MDEKLDMVINAMRITTGDNEGVVIDPLGIDDGVLRIRYFEGTNEECPECVMAPDSFRDMVKRMCAMQAPYVDEVEILPVG